MMVRLNSWFGGTGHSGSWFLRKPFTDTIPIRTVNRNQGKQSTKTRKNWAKTLPT